MQHVKFFSLSAALATKSTIWQDIGAGETMRIATLNAQFFMEARHNLVFKETVERMTHCTIDGSGPAILNRIAHTLGLVPNIERYSGADLVEDLFATYADGSKNFYFLGWDPTQPDLAEQAAKQIRTKYPKISIVGAESGGTFAKNQVSLDPAVTQRILDAKTDILLVGMGAPKQEFWINAARDLNVQVMIGIGGTLKFYTIRTRAPQWIRTVGLEWLYRGFKEPGHWGRVFEAVIAFPIVSCGWLITSLFRRGKKTK